MVHLNCLQGAMNNLQKYGIGLAQIYLVMFFTYVENFEIMLGDDMR